MSEVLRFGNVINPITCHAWNKDRTQIALCPNSTEVEVYKKVGSEWKFDDILDDHDLRVMGIDWAPNTNRIVTCAMDRNAYVWTQGEDKKWKPALVLLRINRAATCVKWSPKENKFAVGSGARLISICYFESENDWWVSKHIKKPIRSTITSIDWHPNNILLVAGSTDFKVRVFSAYVKDIEDPMQPNAWGQANGVMGQLLAEFPNSAAGGGWVRSVGFSPDGNKIAWVGQDSSVNVADATKNTPVFKLRTQFLPFLNCIWISNDYIVVAGHSCMPILYGLQPDGQIVYISKLDTSQKREVGGITAMKKFQSLDKQARMEGNDTSVDTIHQNAITSLVMYNNASSTVKFSTGGLDGQLVIWTVSDTDKELEHLKTMFSAMRW